MLPDRRLFLRRSLAAGAVLAAPAVLRSSSKRTCRTALIGSGWWGMNIARMALASGRCDLVALCDVDGSILEAAVEDINTLSGRKPHSYRDFRELLLREKPQIVIVATPDHWHALITIAALQSGAHVYVEKPVGHTIKEGRAMVRAARETGRKVQVGTHRRGSPHNISAMEFLRKGGAGDIGMVRAFVHSSGGHGRITPDTPPPDNLDWDMWCGPAPLRPYNRRIHPRGFRSFLDYANGRLGDWGIHWMDHILWWSEEKYPRRIYSSGGRFILEDNTDAPDTQIVTFTFESFTAVWEHRTYAGNASEKHRIGCYFYGTEGILHIGWHDGWTFYDRESGEPLHHEEPKLHEPDAQNIPELWADFLDAIESNRRPTCDIEIGHLSTNMSLLGMLSHKIGRSIEWDGEAERVVNDDEANALLRRNYRPPWIYPGS